MILRGPVHGRPALPNTVYMQSKSMSRSSRAGETLAFFIYTDFYYSKSTFSSQTTTWPPWAPGAPPSSQIPSRLLPDCSQIVAKVTQTRLRCQGYAAKVTLPRLHSQGYFAKVAQPRLHSLGYTAKVALPRLRSQGYVSVTQPRLQSQGDKIEDPKHPTVWGRTPES